MDHHANSFVADMAKRYRNKTYDKLQASLRDRKLPSTENKVEAVKSCLRYEKQEIAEIMLYDAQKATVEARRRAENASHEGKRHEDRTTKQNASVYFSN